MSASPNSPFLRARRCALAVTAVAATAASALVSAAPAAAAPGGVVISEINYHAGSDLDTDDFVELTNTGSTAVDVTGWTVADAFVATLSGAIPAGGRYVIAANAAQFQATNGRAAEAAFTSGKLANSSEPVTVLDAAGIAVDTVTYGDKDPWPASPDGTGPTLELRDLLADNADAANWGPSTAANGTPGAKNSIEGTLPAPVVQDLAATPARPAPGEAVTVSAALKKGSMATVTYKVLFGADVQVPMLDDAGSPGGAGDGVYAAQIPGQAKGALVRYRVDSVYGSTAYSAPAAADTVRYRGVVVKDPSVATQLPVIEWFMEDAVYDDLLADHRLDDVQGDAVWAYDGQVWDGVKMNIRGASSRLHRKVNWKVEFPKGYTFDLGGRLPYALDEFALQNYTIANADISWATVTDSGAKSLTIIPVRTQKNGAFWSLGRIMETQDGTWRKAEGVDDWEIYKGQAGSLRTYGTPEALAASLDLDQKEGDEDDWSGPWELTQKSALPKGDAQLAWIHRNVDVPQVVDYLAMKSIIRHTDSGWHNWYIARDVKGTGRWQMWQWDLDLTFRTAARDDKGVFLTPDTSNRFTTALLQYPEIREMFYRRLRTMADAYYGAGRYEAQWDAIAAATAPDWALDVRKWGGTTAATAKQQFLDGVKERRATFAKNTPSLMPTSQSATAGLVISELHYAPAGAGGEFIELANPGSTAVDASGWTLGAVGLTLQPGTVVPARSRVVVVQDDVAFRAAHSGNRLVVGQYPGSLDDAGETVVLEAGTRVVDSVTYTADAPWPAAAAGAGPSLELLSLTADNADPASWVAVTDGGTPARAAAPATSAVAADSFDRSAANGLGSADKGGPWTVSGTTSHYAVTNGAARITSPAGQTRQAVLGDVRSTDTDLVATATFARPTAGTVYLGVIGRKVGSADYRARVAIGSSGSVRLSVERGDVALRSVTVSGLTFASGDSLRFRLQVTGTAPTTLQAKVWKAGTAEPATWQVVATDGTAALQAAGSVGLTSYVSKSGRPTPLVIAWDDLASTGTR